MDLLVVQEFDLLLSPFRFNLSSLYVALVKSINLGFKFDCLVVCLQLPRVQLLNSLLKICFAVLSLQLLTHGKRHTGLIQGLVGSDRHLDLVSDPDKEQASFWLAQSHLSDDLIKALGEKFLSDWADAAFASLSLHQLLVKHLTKTCHIDSSGLLVARILNVVLAVLDPLSWRQNSIQNVFV